MSVPQKQLGTRGSVAMWLKEKANTLAFTLRAFMVADVVAGIRS